MALLGRGEIIAVQRPIKVSKIMTGLTLSKCTYLAVVIAACKLKCLKLIK